MKRVLAITFMVVSTLAITEGLSCLPCSNPEVKCTAAFKLGCKGGLTFDPCGCCAVCAKVRKERCGGLFNVVGKCDCGLSCRSPTVNHVGICV